MTSTPNNATFNMSGMEGAKTGKILVSGTLSYLVVDEETVGFNPDSWSMWSEASTIPVRENLRDDADKENYSTAANMGETDRMDVEVVDSDDEEHEVTLKEILSDNLNNTTVNIEEGTEEPEVVIASIRHFNVQSRTYGNGAI